MHTSEHEHIRRIKERNSSFYFFFIARASSSTARDSRAVISSLLALSGMHGPHHASLPVLLGRIATTLGSHGELPSHATCMHCMHQKTDYACYAGTQLRKRLHTMHTETRIGVFVGLRARKCMQLGMHTKRIQNAYKHKKEDSSLYFFFILSVLLSFHCPRSTASILAARVFRHV